MGSLPTLPDTVTSLLIAGDVGGTKTDLGVYSLAGGPRAPLARKEFASRRYPSLAAMVRDFVTMVDHRVERGCSGGSGIPNLYSYLRATGHAAESPAIARDLASAPDRSRFIAESALRPLGADPLCAATLGLFVSILAAEAANLALKVLATGGVYLAGGIAPQLLPLLEGGAFMKAFVRKGRLEELLRRVPVHVI